MSQPILAISLFFHILATVIWIGGILIITLLVIPEVNRILADQLALYQVLLRLRKRFSPISNLALVVLITTGLFQMTADPNYDGLMQFNNTWSQIMLIKHILIAVMALVGLFLQFSIAPALERTSLLLERGKGEIADWQALRQREQQLTWVIVLFAILILGMSAWLSSI
jgi:putative copper export protein